MRGEGFFHCDCYGEGISVAEEDGDVFLSFFEFGFYRPRSWRGKARLIWKIIKTGEPYKDQVVVRKENIPALVELLLNPPPL